MQHPATAVRNIGFARNQLLFCSCFTAPAMLVLARPVTLLICCALSLGCRVRQNRTIYSGRVNLKDFSICAARGPT
jgi:hypothetical protein